MKEGKNLTEKQLEQSIYEAKRVLDVEACAIQSLKSIIDENFKKIISLILKNQGRLVLTGVGKSGIVARKIAATFSSLGTPAFFVHAAEALHGDLGMITNEDVLLIISNSGETEEILNLLPSLRRIGVSLIVLTGNKKSTLARNADLCLLVSVSEEACNIGLAPTTSTTSVMALGDALAVALSTIKGFTPEDYAVYHPGGSLGRKLLTTVGDVLKIRQQNPLINQEKTVREALFTMTDSNMGSTSVVNDRGELIGIITDGDIRRLARECQDFLNKKAKDCMTFGPVTIKKKKLAVEALRIMEEKEIKDLPVVKDNKPVGMLNFQDLLRARVY